jgi:Carbohydrate esterase, sialic acid-specific acetylesterase
MTNIEISTATEQQKSGILQGLGAAKAKGRKFIVVAGQSNTYYGRGFIDPLVLAEIPVEYRNIEPRLKMLVRDGQNHRLSLVPASWRPIDQGLPDGGHGYGYLLGRHILSTLQSNEELIIVTVAVGGTGWSNNRWKGNDDLWLMMCDQIRHCIGHLDAECLGMFWSQGEQDITDPWGAIYKHLLPNMAMTLRNVIGHATGNMAVAHTVPFCTFDMVPAWVAANAATAQRVQDVLTNIGSTIPKAANLNVTFAGDLESDQIHYDSRQQMQIAKGLYQAWIAAKASSYALPSPPSGETLIFRQTAPTAVPFTNKWSFLDQNSAVVDGLTVPIFSRLGEAWKFQNTRRTYKYRYQVIGGGARPVTGNIVFEQNYTPFSFNGYMMQAALLSADIMVGNHDNSGFGGLALLNDNVASNTALCSFSVNNPVSWWGPVGQNAVYSNIIPIYKPYGNSNDTMASEVRLYAVVD